MIHTAGVTGSIPVPPTKIKHLQIHFYGVVWHTESSVALEPDNNAIL